MKLTALLNSEPMLAARNWYRNKYGKDLRGIPEEIRSQANFMRVTPLQMAEAIFRLNIPENRIDLYW